jgi:cytochrome c oxidase subunit 2
LALALIATGAAFALTLGFAALTWYAERPAPAPKARALPEDAPARAALITFVLWLALTAVGLYVALTIDYYPTIASDKGEEIAHAFRLLTAFAVPVGALVLAMLAYSLLRHSSEGRPEGDGPAFEGTGLVPKVWLLWTAALTLVIIVYPGLTSLEKVMATDSTPDLTVTIEGVQWTWIVGYPEQGVLNQPELVLPVDRSVNFQITSRDVIHSFWIPSMLMKVDAVPGLTTTLTMRPTQVGEYSSDPQVRLQCTELCGVGHSTMRIPVRVVSEREFRDWIQQHQKAPAGQ